MKHLSDEFHLSASDTVWILAAFQAGYVIVVGATGWLGDKISPKKIVFSATLITGLYSTFFIWGAQGKMSIMVLGMFADRKGRTMAIIMASCLSVMAQFLLGYLYGHSLAMIVIVGVWIGFWVIADSAIYKAGLTEMVLPRIRSTSLGLQSVAGYAMTMISPMIFGKILERYNGAVAAAHAKIWGPAFLVLGLGGILAPVAALFPRRQRQARLMADGKM